MGSSDTSLEEKIQDHENRKKREPEYNNTYMCEYRDLLIWRISEEDAVASIPWSGGQDGPHTMAMNEIAQEWLKRHRVLKEKYHID